MSEKAYPKLRDLLLGLSVEAGGTIHFFRDQCAELAAELRQLFAEHEALKPFAAAYNGDGPECDEWNAWESPCAMGVTYGDFRRAHSSISPIQEPKQ